MMTNDPRSLQEILAQHPAPWQIVTLPVVVSGATQLRIVDRLGNEVLLFTAMRVVELTLDAAAVSA